MADSRRMSDRERAMQRTGQKNRRKKRKVRKAFLWFFFLMVIGTVVTLSLTIWFPVQKIAVSGESIYSQEQIIGVAAIPDGQNLFLVPTDTVAERIEKSLPYIESVTAKKVFPGTIKIVVSQATVAACYQIDSGYLLISNNSKILEKSSVIPDGVTVLKGIESQTETVGETLVIADADKSVLLNEILTALGSYNIQTEIIDLTDTVDIVAKIDNRLIVELGPSTDLTYKIAHLSEMLKQMDATSTGVISLKLWSSDKPEAYFRNEDITQYRQ